MSAQRPESTHSLPAEAGFTVVELLVTVSVVAILTALAAPSFKPLIDRWRVRDALEAMQSTIYLARSEGIKRGGRVAIQKLPNTPASCTLASTNEEWGCGWFVYADNNSDGVWQPTEERLRTVATPANTNVIHQGGGQSIKVDRYGMMSGLNAKGFIFSPEPDGIASSATQGLCVSSGGRIRVIKEVPCT